MRLPIVSVRLSEGTMTTTGCGCCSQTVAFTEEGTDEGWNRMVTKEEMDQAVKSARDLCIDVQVARREYLIDQILQRQDTKSVIRRMRTQLQKSDYADLERIHSKLASLK